MSKNYSCSGRTRLPTEAIRPELLNSSTLRCSAHNTLACVTGESHVCASDFDFRKSDLSKSSTSFSSSVES